VLLPLAAFDLQTATLRNVLSVAMPEAVLLLMACVIFLGGTIWANRHLWGCVSLASIGLAALVYFNRPLPANLIPSISPLIPDQLAELVRIIAYAGGAVLLLLFWQEIDDAHASDFHACVLLLVAGVSLIGSANDLIIVFLSLELISIPTYVMLYLPRTGICAQEAAIKYFLLSIFSSALLLFGLSYLYGMEGQTNLTAFFQAQSQHPESVSSLVLVAFVMVVAGLGFRITAVPFHFYAPDVFQGAPISVAAMLAFIPKVAGFTAIIRVLGLLGQSSSGSIVDPQIALLFWLLAAITMTVGNVLALLQDNLKRILAYSSIAHGGYMLIGLAATPFLRDTGPRGLHGSEAVYFYLIAYGAMTVGAFAVIHYLRSADRDVETVDDVAGLGRTHPLMALALALFLFSLIGLPLTAGFSGKFLLFFSAIEAEHHLTSHHGLFIALAIIGALNAAIGAYYYLRIVAAMYLREAIRPLVPTPQAAAPIAVAVCVILTIVLGIRPTPFVQFIRSAIANGSVAVVAESASATR
jgi:NADH-quinone oxidoreductase subunit N